MREAGDPKHAALEARLQVVATGSTLVRVPDNDIDTLVEIGAVFDKRVCRNGRVWAGYRLRAV
jgi:hypothetical protein